MSMARFYENKDASIICPKCRKLLVKADRRDPNAHKIRCKNCKRYIMYTPLTGETEHIDLPERMTASGKVFY